MDIVNGLKKSTTYWLATNSTYVINYVFIAAIVLGLIYLTIVSVIVSDVNYPRNHPWLFTLETLLFSLGCGAVIFLMAYGRDKIRNVTFVQFAILSLKFGLFHILLQFSGYYTYAFSS